MQSAWRRGGAAAAVAALVVLILNVGLIQKVTSPVDLVSSVSKSSSSSSSISSNAKTTSLDTTKVTWGKLRPEHPAYYPNSIYLFTGRESSVYAKHNEIHAIRSILKNGPSPTDVHNFNSLRVSALRAVAWDKAAHVVVFPSFAEYPDLHMISKTDIKSYASTGNNVVFMGGFGTLDVMNEIFGWQLMPVTYQEGPFYRSDRNAHNTVMATMPSMVSKSATGGGTFGVRVKSLPAGARSYYDSLGDSVLFAVRYDLGMVTYVGSDVDSSSNAEWHKLLRAAVSL